MKCACGEKTVELLSCSRCYTSYCDRCNPYFDAEQNVCQSCQEQEQIRALSEDRFTGKLRVWFNDEATIWPQPALMADVPWKTNGDEILSNGSKHVARFASFHQLLYAVNAANKHHALSTIVATVYNRIREGHVLFDGSEEDVKLWQEAKKLLEP